ncbi:hypothetical protein [Brevundimonas sp. NIBR11]|uniref:hypothetical protein n=1 Tax=Brevundimonas sp. NIBR11 TaxID=3015999 RepID=UPI0022F0D67D|nr:hypothetical protein [Brevundimonas sp. NIBR11]WGM31405.1 hypothetical protein KKHFBJBL_01649 [Brevundimonas sp. NIBR11]
MTWARTRDLGRRFSHRVRNARHPFAGWRKWAVITGQGLAGFVGLFLACNLVLSLSTFRGEDPASRTAHELAVLWYSTPDGVPTSDQAFRVIHGGEVGDNPTTADIRAHFEGASEGGTFLLDQVMVDRMQAINGRIDSRVMPPGVYVGAHALGPDDAPLVWATKWMAQYLFFPRHAYILVVPAQGEAIAFSASEEGKFPGPTDHPGRLSARLSLYSDAAYDFPSSGEALHEMTIVSRDPTVVAAAPAALDLARRRLEAENLTYGLLAPNSNTVVGCILEGAGLMPAQVRRSILLALRAPGMGAACPPPGEGP